MTILTDDVVASLPREELQRHLSDALGTIAILNHQLNRAHLSEQSRIDAAVAKERERCAEALLVWRDSIPTNAGGWYAGRRNGLESAAMMVRSMPAALPTPTTEEGA